MDIGRPNGGVGRFYSASARLLGLFDGNVRGIDKMHSWVKALFLPQMDPRSHKKRQPPLPRRGYLIKYACKKNLFKAFQLLMGLQRA